MSFISKYKSVIKLILCLVLFFFIDLVIYIPINIFNIDPNWCSARTVYSLNLLSELSLMIILVFMYKNDLKRDFIDYKNNLLNYADTGFKCYIVGVIVMFISNLLIMVFSPVKMANNETSVRSIISNAPIIAFILTTFLAPFVEETIFRKSFGDAIKNKIVYVLVSGLVFGSLHVLSSVTSWYDYLYIIPYSSLGIAFAISYAKTNNIFTSMTYHLLHNGVLTLLSIFTQGAMILL